jgi:DNA-binding PadR family transcriptional regulator
MFRPRRCSAQTLLLLGTLNEKPRQWQHGYELSKATGLKSGTLYPILMRLFDRGLLDAKWQGAAHPGRPPRHMYRLTARGVAYANGEIAACARFEASAIRAGRS